MALTPLTRDIPEKQLRQGDLGAVVLVHADGQAYEVEFFTLGGETVAVMTRLPMPCGPSRGARSPTMRGGGMIGYRRRRRASQPDYPT